LKETVFYVSSISCFLHFHCLDPGEFTPYGSVWFFPFFGNFFPFFKFSFCIVNRTFFLLCEVFLNSFLPLFSLFLFSFFPYSLYFICSVFPFITIVCFPPVMFPTCQSKIVCIRPVQHHLHLSPFQLPPLAYPPNCGHLA
jgi:hypothetical protein